MLPPVRAALNSNTDHSGLAPQTTSRARIDIAQAIALPDDDGAMPLSGRSLDLVSLSGQLKLAQGSSIFAETIGRLLKVPRQENEPLADYAARLTEAVQALKPAERAALERMLNQLVKGISVRLLTEILKDPAGPTAARIALQMETASSSQRDLVAKAVISSYRQNGSNEFVAGAKPAQPAPIQKPEMVAAAPAATTAAATPAQPQSTEQAQQQQTGEANEPPAAATFGKDAQKAGNEPQAPRPPATGSAGQPLAFVQSPASQPRTGTEGGAAAQPLAGDGATALPSEAIDSEGAPLPSQDSKTRTALTAAAIRPADEARAVPSGEGARVSSPTSQASARVAEQTVTAGIPEQEMQSAELEAKGDEKLPVPLSREMLRQELMLAARESVAMRADKPISDLFGWLAGLFAEPEAPQQAQPAARPTTQTAVPLPPEAEQPTATGDEGKTEAGAAGTAAPSTERTAARGEPNTIAAARAQPASAGQTAGETVEQQIAAGMAATLVATAREGIPHPYVAYPPAEDEPRREERRARAIAEIGDEEEDGRSQDHGFQGEEQPDDEADGGEDPQNEAQADDLTLADNDEGRPNDLYWRMAGWR